MRNSTNKETVSEQEKIYLLRETEKDCFDIFYTGETVEWKDDEPILKNLKEIGGLLLEPSDKQITGGLFGKMHSFVKNYEEGKKELQSIGSVTYFTKYLDKKSLIMSYLGFEIK